MQPILRRFLVVAAIAAGGSFLGVSLGNFAAGDKKMSGLEELATYESLFQAENRADAEGSEPELRYGREAGPDNYVCQGCDASLYNATIPSGMQHEELDPLPPYRVEDEVPIRKAGRRPGQETMEEIPTRKSALPPGQKPSLPNDDAELR